MPLQEGIEILQQNLLYIAILAIIFFYGDYIYHWVKNFVKEKVTDNLYGGFVMTLCIILILSAIPIILAQMFMDSDSNFLWFIIVVLLIASFWRYYQDN